MSADSLLDTNIIYLLDASQPARYQRLEQLVQVGLQHGQTIEHLTIKDPFRT